MPPPDLADALAFNTEVGRFYSFDVVRNIVDRITMEKDKLIPWDDAAVLIRRGDIEFGREIVAEGSLRQIVDIVAATHVIARDALEICLPDRHVPPFSYPPLHFTMLMTDKIQRQN